VVARARWAKGAHRRRSSAPWFGATPVATGTLAARALRLVDAQPVEAASVVQPNPAVSESAVSPIVFDYDALAL